MLSSKKILNCKNNNKITPVPLESEGSSDEDEDNREMEGKTYTASGNEVHEKNINFSFLLHSILFYFLLIPSTLHVYPSCIVVSCT